MNWKDLSNMAEDIFNTPPKKERVVKIAAYCRGRNGAHFYEPENLSLCNHPECNNCRIMENAIKEEVESQLNKYNGLK